MSFQILLVKAIRESKSKYVLVRYDNSFCLKGANINMENQFLWTFWCCNETYLVLVPKPEHQDDQIESAEGLLPDEFGDGDFGALVLVFFVDQVSAHRPRL